LEAPSWEHREQEQVHKVSSGKLENENVRKSLGAVTLIFSVTGKCFEITKAAVREVPGLTWSKEEADTRLAVHARHTTGTHKHVIVILEDTDVFVML
jgi:hypothetical protein